MKNIFPPSFERTKVHYITPSTQRLPRLLSGCVLNTPVHPHPRAHLVVTQLHIWPRSVFHVYCALHTYLLSSKASGQNNTKLRQNWNLNPYSTNHWYVSFSKELT